MYAGMAANYELRNVARCRCEAATKRYTRNGTLKWRVGRSLGLGTHRLLLMYVYVCARPRQRLYVYCLLHDMNYQLMRHSPPPPPPPPLPPAQF